ncbi:MAG: beta galactosidase jelly roll domain-containing protein, partial [Calditrichaceae bacterium]
INLTGIWKFKSGDYMEWKEKDYKDTDWNEVFVPALWSQYGLKGYDGFGWYRKEFKIPAQYKDEHLILLLGKIDDMDEVYLNGREIGHTGHMYSDPRRNKTNNRDYQQERAYTIPSSYLNPNGINLLAVRVYDDWLYGGIYDGPVGLVTRDRYIEWERDYDSGKNFKNIFEMIFGE